MNPGSEVIGKDRMACAVFRVVRISRNGWLTVKYLGDVGGRRFADGFVCKFRTTEMMPFNGGAK